jgi:hypothetical protein
VGSIQLVLGADRRLLRPSAGMQPARVLRHAFKHLRDGM